MEIKNRKPGFSSSEKEEGPRDREGWIFMESERRWVVRFGPRVRNTADHTGAIWGGTYVSTSEFVYKNAHHLFGCLIVIDFVSPLVDLILDGVYLF